MKTIKAPKSYKGKKLYIEEEYISPHTTDKKKDAQKYLREIRESHLDWKELSAEIRKGPDGKWRAVRYHALYK